MANDIFGQTVTWDSLSLMADGRRILPVMGEIHYSRVPAQHWQRELRKMKEGGVTMVATYCFWNHIEEVEGQFDWSGQRNLRQFLEACREEQMPVVLRVGPFCHGEVRCGGIPDWIFTKGCKSRSEDPEFLKYVRRLYEQIFGQVSGLQWKDGGPLIAMQFDNEYRGRGSYLMTLKRMAGEIGFDLPFYTRTGWPRLATPVPFGEMLPLYGDYSDGFWDREITEGCGTYWQAFHFKPYRLPTATATEQLGRQDGKQDKTDADYPFFTCEQGGGMASSYHRRIWIAPQDVYASAIVKLGCGSNLLGYYMYHGGTNPDGKRTTLNENQRTPATNYNDMPVKTYDFQAPLGEFGQRNPSYFKIRPLHLFLHDFGAALAPMQAHYPQADMHMEKADDSHLRWTYRTDGNSSFIFINNYERFANLSEKRDVECLVNGTPYQLPTIPAGTSCILPCNVQLGDVHLKSATAQLVARRDNRFYFMEIPGIAATFSMDNGARQVRPDAKHPVVKQGGTELWLLSEHDAGRLFLPKEKKEKQKPLIYNKVKEAGTLRTITMGVQKVAEEPTDADFEQAAVYAISLPKKREGLVSIVYRGDVARLYADGLLIDDNFYNGRPFEYDLSLLPNDCGRLELRILPLQADAPIYLPRQAKFSLNGKPSAERVESIVLRY